MRLTVEGCINNILINVLQMSTSFLILLTLIPRGTPSLFLPLDGLLLLCQLENDFLPRLNNYVGVRPVVDEVGEKLDRFSFK